MITARDVQSVYEVPLAFADEGLDEIMLNQLTCPTRARHRASGRSWSTACAPAGQRDHSRRRQVRRSRTRTSPSTRRCSTAAFKHRLRSNIEWIEAEELETGKGSQRSTDAVGILVPGGFGERGAGGMMKAVEVARTREHSVLRHLLGHAVGDRRVRAQRLRPGPKPTRRRWRQTPATGDLQAARPAGVDELGGTMRLGAYACQLKAGSLHAELYGGRVITSGTATATSSTRSTSTLLAKDGMKVVGHSPDGKFVEIVELPDHPWFIACSSTPSSSRSRWRRTRSSRVRRAAYGSSRRRPRRPLPRGGRHAGVSRQAPATARP